MTAATAIQGTRVTVDPVELAGLRVTATTRAYREHLETHDGCVDLSWCTERETLDAEADIAAHAYGRLRGK